MELRKDDPVYYKKIITGLINQAIEEGLKINAKASTNGIRIDFEADNGDIAGIELTK